MLKSRFLRDPNIYYRNNIYYRTEKIVVEKTKISMYINMEKVVAVKLVPRTGIEPVWVSLPEGF